MNATLSRRQHLFFVSICTPKFPSRLSISRFPLLIGHHHPPTNLLLVPAALCRRRRWRVYTSTVTTPSRAEATNNRTSTGPKVDSSGEGSVNFWWRKCLENWKKMWPKGSDKGRKTWRIKGGEVQSQECSKSTSYSMNFYNFEPILRINNLRRKVI